MVTVIVSSVVVVLMFGIIVFMVGRKEKNSATPSMPPEVGTVTVTATIDVEDDTGRNRYLLKVSEKFHGILDDQETPVAYRSYNYAGARTRAWQWATSEAPIIDPRNPSRMYPRSRVRHYDMSESVIATGSNP